MGEMMRYDMIPFFVAHYTGFGGLWIPELMVFWAGPWVRYSARDTTMDIGAKHIFVVFCADSRVPPMYSLPHGRQHQPEIVSGQLTGFKRGIVTVRRSTIIVYCSVFYALTSQPDTQRACDFWSRVHCRRSVLLHVAAKPKQRLSLAATAKLDVCCLSEKRGGEASHS